MLTEQEIIERLQLLNQLQQDWSPTTESQRAQEKGIRNSLKWFRDNHIQVRQKRVESKWEIEE